jgi:hypothetical protein
VLEPPPEEQDDIFCGAVVWAVPSLADRYDTKKFPGSSDTNSERDEHVT